MVSQLDRQPEEDQEPDALKQFKTVQTGKYQFKTVQTETYQSLKQHRQKKLTGLIQLKGFDL